MPGFFCQPHPFYYLTDALAALLCPFKGQGGSRRVGTSTLLSKEWQGLLLKNLPNESSCLGLSTQEGH